eukprot:CAMPEP_0170560074 /NCGR_PEP_ID=MMETSP0211-20121228/46864_1 /TAXON_ID=311385 /ORGANISM="Pseudokeronopsis sp., Strain OXSARD2" /LENGTH=30 /DNA_ID= /DNA_START= /DNA_END= /DNA_ORIENTATION=
MGNLNKKDDKKSPLPKIMEEEVKNDFFLDD